MTDETPVNGSPTDKATAGKDGPKHVAQDATAPQPAGTDSDATERPTEIGGQKGPEPTRYGDWERGGRCTDF